MIFYCNKLKILFKLKIKLESSILQIGSNKIRKFYIGTLGYIGQRFLDNSSRQLGSFCLIWKFVKRKKFLNFNIKLLSSNSLFILLKKLYKKSKFNIFSSPLARKFLNFIIVLMDLFCLSFIPLFSTLS